MRITILGTGLLAESLGAMWARAGHDLVIGGRSVDKARALAARIGHGTRAAVPRAAVEGREAVLLAVSWHGVTDILREAEAEKGSLCGATLIDPTNAVDHGIGILLTGAGESQAERIAALAPGAHVVKAFHLFPAQQWTDAVAGPVTVAMCGDGSRPAATVPV
ncbi:NADPH-dependent F420 reductase [Nocardia cyriacigeorgica]|uniref:NADPH-dependent F420 reductase n=1 Tax=Nocardia cyriacigeorgica TaxID=135487 RepID=UPI001894D1BD|nr:NAD(P)-binding domain-containing protein [Nocardia cyriacigeorgica]MBF6439815.1 NAD(P)-binding domain-containing protein [Nocardia cyriacigeorgica]